jgi:hypothetical protein
MLFTKLLETKIDVRPDIITPTVFIPAEVVNYM